VRTIPIQQHASPRLALDVDPKKNSRARPDRTAASLAESQEKSESFGPVPFGVPFDAAACSSSASRPTVAPNDLFSAQPGQDGSGSFGCSFADSGTTTRIHFGVQETASGPTRHLTDKLVRQDQGTGRSDPSGRQQSSDGSTTAPEG
jgi:hypothetical protein